MFTNGTYRLGYLKNFYIMDISDCIYRYFSLKPYIFCYKTLARRKDSLYYS